MAIVKVSELQGAALDWAVMTLQGFRLVRVGYFGLGPQDDTEFNESPEQGGLPKWFEDATGCSVGAYWMRESDMQVLSAFWPHYMDVFSRPASPSTDWSQCGPLIDKYKILLCPPEDEPYWEASVGGDHEMHLGDAPLVAICRAIVSAKLGDEIDVPDELIDSAS